MTEKAFRAFSLLHYEVKTTRSCKAERLVALQDKGGKKSQRLQDSIKLSSL